MVFRSVFWILCGVWIALFLHPTTQVQFLQFPQGFLSFLSGQLLQPDGSLVVFVVAGLFWRYLFVRAVVNFWSLFPAVQENLNRYLTESWNDVKWPTVVFWGPLIEESVFRSIPVSFLVNGFQIGSTPIWWGMVLVFGVVFALLHLTNYTQFHPSQLNVVAVTAVGHFFYTHLMVGCYLVLGRNPWVVLAPLLAHAFHNAVWSHPHFKWKN